MPGCSWRTLDAFLAGGVVRRLHGDAHDNVGKGLSGGRLVERPDLDDRIVLHLQSAGDPVAPCAHASRQLAVAGEVFGIAGQ